MKQSLLISILVLSVAGFAYGQSGVCAVNVTFDVLTCGNSAGCSDVYPVTWIGDPCDFTGACEYFVNTTTSCCGIQGYSYLTDSGTTCEWAKLKDPGIRKELLELTANEDILIPNCSGAYVPATAALARL